MSLPDDHIWLIPPREEEQEEFLSYLFARVMEQIEPYMAHCQLDFLRSLPDHLFRFIAQRILYPQSWDTEEQSFFEMLREEIEDVSECCDELRYRDADYDDLEESLIPYSGDPII